MIITTLEQAIVNMTNVTMITEVAGDLVIRTNDGQVYTLVNTSLKQMKEAIRLQDLRSA